MAVFRIRVHGSSIDGRWWKVQARQFWFWWTLSSYIGDPEEAEDIVNRMIRLEGGRWAGGADLPSATDRVSA